ncbi:APT1 phosphoribosyltransferase, partial [Tricholaema leucomelas]|nr:APT1 phosphoribosyltransferase [Tricholaema leucomelas]
LHAQCPQCLQSSHMDLCHTPSAQEKGWYLALMAPNVKGSKYAWLDPSRLYCHPQGLQNCLSDLLQPFQGDPIDMVAGIDAMGFILGAAAAARLQKGFLAIRKAGHLCVQTRTQPYTDYSGREKVMEVRTDAISPGELVGCSLPEEGFWNGHQALRHSLCPLPGLRILLVDQWIETGGTMRAAIQLVEQLGGLSLPCVPTGVAAICIEDSEGGRWIQEHYKCAHCVPPHLQPHFNRHQ